MKKLMLGLILFYQKFIPKTDQGCRFSPTCSQYAYQAVSECGILHGSILAVKRLLKCHPWHPGGYDPVK